MVYEGWYEGMGELYGYNYDNQRTMSADIN